MQIIQIADLHINSHSNLDHIKNKINKLFEALRLELKRDDCTVICILGDLVDKGDKTKYEDVLKILNFIKTTFSEFRPSFEFTHGNHDLCSCPLGESKPNLCENPKCSLENFVEAIKQFDSTYVYASVLHKEYKEIDLLLVNSVFHRNCKFGLIDIDALKDLNVKKPTLLLTHHTFLSENTDDASAMRNAYKIFEVIEEKEIVGILHGHTHGYKDISIGNKCPIIGVGPFLKNVPTVNNQVNLVIVSETGIHQAINYHYMGDRDVWLCDTVFAKQDNIYKGGCIKKNYDEILYDTKRFGVIPNMRLHLSMRYQSFNDEIEALFSTQIEVAKLWQQTDSLPSSLYYNHGQHMKCDEKTGIQFVVDELKSKATSSRALIPLINFEQVLNSGDNFLPSFDLIQFGFQEEAKSKLYVTLYLRALEVNHFLKINLCEIYLICKEISKEIRTFASIDITIMAFRAQYKEQYGCFKKAEIDTLGEAKMVVLLQNRVDKVINLLVEKRNLSETVVETNGMKNLLGAINALHEMNPITETVITQVKRTLSVMESLKVERSKSSNYQSIMPLEQQVTDAFDVTIALFQGGDIYEP